MIDPWPTIAAEHDLTAADAARARRYAARGDRVVVVESGWFHRGRYVTARPDGELLDVVAGRVVAAYRPDGTPIERVV